MKVDLAQAIRRVIAPLQRRVSMLVTRAVITLVDDALKTQSVQLQLLEGMVRDDVENMQQYGFASHPFPDCSAIAVAVGGSTDHLVVVATGDKRYRPLNLIQGEACLYTHQGVPVHAKLDGFVDLGLGDDFAPPTEFLARSDLVDAEIDALWAYILEHTHPTGTGPSGPPIEPELPAHGSTAAEKVKGV